MQQVDSAGAHEIGTDEAVNGRITFLEWAAVHFCSASQYSPLSKTEWMTAWLRIPRQEGLGNAPAGECPSGG